MKITLRLRSPRSLGLFLLSVFLLTSCDYYPENGKWVGELLITDERSRESYRCPVEVDLYRSTGAVNVRSLEVRCGWQFSRSLFWRASDYERRGTDLVKDGQRIGDIYPDGTVRIDMRDPQVRDNYPNRADRLVLTWSHIGEGGLHFSLREDYEGKSRTLEGRLQRSDAKTI